jgi:hypothetical protein
MDENLNAAPVSPAPASGGKGSLIGAIIVVIILIIGAVYLLNNRAAGPAGEETATTTPETTEVSDLEAAAGDLGTADLEAGLEDLDEAVTE